MDRVIALESLDGFWESSLLGCGMTRSVGLKPALGVIFSPLHHSHNIGIFNLYFNKYIHIKDGA